MDPWMSPRSEFAVRPINVLLMAIKAIGFLGELAEDSAQLHQFAQAGLDVPDDPEWRKRHPKPKRFLRPVREAASEALSRLEAKGENP